MTEPSPRRPRRRVLPAAALVLLACVWAAPTLTGGTVPPLALWNTSPSVPTGLYLYFHHLDVARPPAHGDYVAVRYPPHFDLPWLLKRVEGVPGDRYCWNGEAGTHELVLYGDTPDSFDDRYRGPTRISDLWGLYRPAWVAP